MIEIVENLNLPFQKILVGRIDVNRPFTIPGRETIYVRPYLADSVPPAAIPLGKVLLIFFGAGLSRACVFDFEAEWEILYVDLKLSMTTEVS